MARRDRVTVEKLHRLVWSKPIRDLAKQWGLYPAQVTKLCDDHRIPRPSSGYWTRRRLGNRDPIVPLPDGVDPDTEIVIGASSSDTSGLSQKAIARLEFERSHPIRVADRLQHPHRLIARTKTRFAKPWKDSDSPILGPGGDGALDIFVTKNSISRALRIFDALIKAAEERGHKIRVKSTQGRSTDTYLLIDHHKFELYMREKQIQVPRKPTADERRWHPERVEAFDMEPTGLLYLNVRRHRWHWPEKQFREGKKRKRLETSLNEFFCTMYRMIDDVERREEERRLEQEARRNEEAQLLAQQKLAEAENHRRDRLLALVERWDCSARILEFAEAFRTTSSLPPEEVETLVAWMSDEADRLNPLRNSQLRP